MKLLAICGSLRKNSYNLQLAKLAQTLCAGRAEFDILQYDDVPIFNEDMEFPAPESVTRVREQVREADGIWFFTPEYNHYFSGALKNLIDWLSRSEGKGIKRPLSQKPAAISGITPGMSGTGIAQDHLVTLLSLLNMRIMNVPRLTIPNAEQQIQDGILKLTVSEPYLKRQVDAFIDFVSGK